MRPKFRQARIAWGEFLHWHHWGYVDDNREHFVDPLPIGVGGESYQYTGRQDKNGKEIYFDSDIVNYTYTSDCGMAEEEEFTVTGIVVLDLKYTNSICVLEKENGKTGGLYHFTAGEVRNIEIIGNTTENPELLVSR